jgi:DNA polymerase V
LSRAEQVSGKHSCDCERTRQVDTQDSVTRWSETAPTGAPLWGIASRLERRLNGYGVTSIWDLATADPVQVRKWFNVVVMRTALELRGIACIGPEEDRTGKKDQQVARRVDVFAGTSHWTEQKHYPSVRVQLPFPTADPVELTRAAHQLLPQIEDGTRYARAGLMLTDLLPAGVRPMCEPREALPVPGTPGTVARRVHGVD